MANSVDLDNTAEKERQILYILIRMLRMANSLDPDQTAENGKNVDPDQTVPENDNVDLVLDHSAENGR